MPLSPPSLDSIKVGYISPTQGYVSGLSIQEANDYDKLNGGVKYAPITRTYGVTNNGAGNYAFTGDGFGSNPTLNVTVGDTLVFNLVAVGHPFWIKTKKITGITDGVTTGKVTNNGLERGTVAWDTTGVKPGTYYYVCQNHTSMQGVINVAAPPARTIYIFRDGDGRVRYLTIDEVNRLTTKDLLRSDSCDTTPKPCGPPTLNFFGGEGIGAEGNPIIDTKGELIAIDIVNGGYGYQTPPFVQVIDPCNNGSGAVVQTLIQNGRVVNTIIVDSGRGYLPPPQTVPQYPALLKLKEVIVKNPGINYNCGVDKMDVCSIRDGREVSATNGTVLSYQCDPYGKIRSVDVVRGGNYTERPYICIDTETGLNATFIPVFEVIRDPLTQEVARDVVQVFDLVGLTVQGYVDGKPYYGNVYFENGLKYAGTQNTGGQITRVYNTKSESILKETQSVVSGSTRIVVPVEAETTPVPTAPTPAPAPTVTSAPVVISAPTPTPAPPPPPSPSPPPPPPPSPSPSPPPPPPPSPSPPPPPPGGGGYGY